MRRRSTGRLPRLMLVSDRRRTRGRDLVDLAGRAVRGGVGMVQLREPDLPDDEVRELVRRLREIVPASITIVVNRSLRVARTARVGLHLPARAAALGNVDLGGAPYGRSVHDDDELRVALDDGADYVVAGTVFATDSKPGRRPGGVAFVERMCRQAHPTPVYAIGGVTVSRVPALIHAGAHGIAVCGALLAANDPERVAQALTLALDVSAHNPTDATRSDRPTP
jgi:thiamine-phosphate pyrophosphorylase